MWISQRLLFNFALFVHVCQGLVQCYWNSEYLCGDACVNNNRVCKCGSDTFTFAETQSWSCCNSSPCQRVSGGDVQCKDGQKQWRIKPCRQTCNQVSRFGYTQQLCSKDKNQCFTEIYSCRGTPKCDE